MGGTEGQSGRLTICWMAIGIGGAAICPGRVGSVETNGVIERFFRTMKEQAIHGRVFQTIDEVRDAVRAFAARYNAEWLIEKNGYLSPLAARAGRIDTTRRHAA